MGSGIPGRLAESSPAWIMSLCSEGLCGVARSLSAVGGSGVHRDIFRRVGGFGGWGREHLDGEVAVRTDYTVCLQLVRRH